MQAPSTQDLPLGHSHTVPHGLTPQSFGHRMKRLHSKQRCPLPLDQVVRRNVKAFRWGCGDFCSTVDVQDTPSPQVSAAVSVVHLGLHSGINGRPGARPDVDYQSGICGFTASGLFMKSSMLVQGWLGNWTQNAPVQVSIVSQVLWRATGRIRTDRRNLHSHLGRILPEHLGCTSCCCVSWSQLQRPVRRSYLT